MFPILKKRKFFGTDFLLVKNLSRSNTQVYKKGFVTIKLVGREDGFIDVVCEFQPITIKSAIDIKDMRRQLVDEWAHRLKELLQ